MKLHRHYWPAFALLGLACAPALAPAQVLPTPQYTPVTAVTATGVLRTPTNLWTANAAGISSAIGLSNYQPLDSDLTAIATLSTTAFGRSCLTVADAAALRALAGTVIGTDVQAYDADLANIAALSTTTYGRSLLTQADAAAARATLALGNVENTSDANKPISTATQAALDTKLAISTAASTYAPLASPTFTGTLNHAGTISTTDRLRIQTGAGTYTADDSLQIYSVNSITSLRKAHHILFPTAHPSGAPWAIWSNSTNFGGPDSETDAIFGIGFNVIRGGDRVVPGTGVGSGAAWFHQWEKDYYAVPGDPNSRLNEWHLNTTDDAGVNSRLFMVTHSPVTNETITAWKGRFTFYPWNASNGFGTNQSFLEVTPSSGVGNGMGLLFSKNSSINWRRQNDSEFALFALNSADRLLVGAPLDMRTLHVRLDGNLDNTSVRPATSADPIPGEIWAHSRQTPTNVDGFLRLSAGGGSGAGATKSRIDISGFSTVPDMNQNVVIYPGATEVARFTTTGAAITGTLSATGNTTVGGEILTVASPIIRPSGTNSNITAQLFPSGTGTQSQFNFWSKSTTSNADYAQLNYVGANRFEILTSALGTGTARAIYLSPGSTQQVEFLPVALGGTVNFAATAPVNIASTTSSTTSTTGALRVGNNSAATNVGIGGGNINAGGTINAGSAYQINGTQVVGPRDTGWTATTGTANKGANATYDAPDISATPTEAEVQAIADAVEAVSQRQKAIEDALRAHGLIN